VSALHFRCCVLVVFSCMCYAVMQGWPEPCLYTVYDRICGDFPAKITVHTPYTDIYIYVCGQPYVCAFHLSECNTGSVASPSLCVCSLKVLGPCLLCLRCLSSATLAHWLHLVCVVCNNVTQPLFLTVLVSCASVLSIPGE